MNQIAKHALIALAVAASIATLGLSVREPEPERIVVIKLRPMYPPPPKPLPPTMPARVLRLRLTSAERVAAARLIANENSAGLRPSSDGGTGGELYADALGVLQVVHDFAAWTGKTHGQALRALGPHVAGNKRATRRRHALYRTLPARGTARPALWRDDVDGPWEVYGENWARLRDAVDEAARDGFEPPCPGAVVAWGNESDDSIAESRGLARVQCAGAVNRFWARAVLPARVAAGDRT